MNAGMNLIPEAERAEDIGLALSKFKDPVPDQASDITASIAALYGIGSALRDIDAVLNSAEHSRNIRLIDEHLKPVRLSLFYILDKVFEILGDLGNGSPFLTDGMYRQTWKDICSFFRYNGSTTLREQLEACRRTVKELALIVRRFAISLVQSYIG
jgi:hypothetical protein